MASFTDGPNNKRLPTPAIACGEHLGHVGHVVSIFSLVIGPGIQIYPQCFCRCWLGPQEPHGQEAEIAFPDLLRAGHFPGAHPAICVLHPLDPHSTDTLQLSVLPNELLGIDQILAWILAIPGFDLLVPVIDPVDPRPLRPRIRLVVAVVPWLGPDLEIRNTRRSLAHGSADAIVSSVTTSDDNNLLAFNVDPT